MKASLTSDGITLTSECGNTEISLKCTSDTAGVFVTNKKTDTCLSLYNDTVQGPVAAFYAKGHDRFAPASIAIAADNGGQLQFQYSGATIMVPLELLLKLKDAP